MNLKTHVREDLWEAVNSSYESKNYTHAILDTFHFLTNKIRQKCATDSGDGETLLGLALGGDSPKLKINKLETDSEINEQKGLHFILMGLYKNVRNPRSHDSFTDNKEDADAIILFVDYLLKIIDKSRDAFDISSFLVRVFDPDFVEDKQYSELLIDEIPENKIFEILVKVYRQKLKGNPTKLKFITHGLIERLDEEKKDQYFDIVSSELKMTSNINEMRYNIILLPPNYWPKLNKAAILRIETKLLNCIETGRYDPRSEEFSNTSDEYSEALLGSWASILVPFFQSKSKLEDVVHKKLTSEYRSDVYFILRFFFSQLHKILSYPYYQEDAVEKISTLVLDSDDYMRSTLRTFFSVFPEEWQNSIKKKLIPLKEYDLDFYNSLEDIPF